MRILMNAGPWLTVPPNGYGGIENVVATLVPELRRRGIHVVLATVADSRLDADERLAVYRTPQFGQLQRPYNRVMGVVNAHMHRVVSELRLRDDIDLVHDHVEAAGLTMLEAMGPSAPPVLHTLHWDLRKHPELYETFDGRDRAYVNGVSASQLAGAPANLRAHSLGHVHNATQLAGQYPSTTAKSDYFAVVGRITPAKGQHIAARAALRAGVDLVLAGPVGPYLDAAALRRGLAEDTAAEHNPDVRYWREHVAPLVDGWHVRWIGTVDSARRNQLVSHARATVFPIQWEEPGGLAAMESLALGTPVVGYRRGCLPELVTEGTTALLCDDGDEDGLARALRDVRHVNPAACALAAAHRFSPASMADRYIAMYRRILALTGGRHGSRRRTVDIHGR